MSQIKYQQGSLQQIYQLNLSSFYTDLVDAAFQSNEMNKIYLMIINKKSCFHVFDLQKIFPKNLKEKSFLQNISNKINAFEEFFINKENNRVKLKKSTNQRRISSFLVQASKITLEKQNNFDQKEPKPDSLIVKQGQVFDRKEHVKRILIINKKFGLLTENNDIILLNGLGEIDGELSID